MKRSSLLLLILILIVIPGGSAVYFLTRGPDVAVFIPEGATDIVIGESVPSPTEPYETQEITYNLGADPLLKATHGMPFMGVEYHGWYRDPKGYTFVGAENFGNVSPGEGISTITIGKYDNLTDPTKPDVKLVVRRVK